MNRRPEPGRRNLLTVISAAAAAGTVPVLFSGCAGLAGPPRITLTAAEITQLLERQFPQDRRFGEVLDVTLQAPRVRLVADKNRLAAVLDLAVRERVLGGRWTGRLDFDSALRWEPRDQTLHFVQPRVADLQLTSQSGTAGSTGSGGGDLRTPAERLGAALVERVLEDMVLYTLSGQRAEALRALGVTPGRVEVTPRGVEITFTAASR
jgi:hypothetical protein